MIYQFNGEFAVYLMLEPFLLRLGEDFPSASSTNIARGTSKFTQHLCYGLLCVFPEIALQKLNEQKDIFTLGDWLVPALMGKRDVKSIWRKIQDHGWWQNDRNL